MILVDSNILIDVLTPDQDWREWSDRKLAELSDTDDELVVNQIVLAELASNFARLDLLLAALECLDIEVLPLTDDAAFAAGQAFRVYRRRHRDRDAILSGFLIGGHVKALGAALLSRDAAIYRAYFPDLTLITPETDA